MVVDAFQDEAIQEHIRLALLRVLRDPEFKAEIARQMVSVAGDPLLQESAATLLANVAREDRVQDALSEIAARTLVEVADSPAVAKEMSVFASKVAHLAMKDYRLYKMFFGARKDPPHAPAKNADAFRVSAEKKLQRNSRARLGQLHEIRQRILANPVDPNRFASRIRGFDLDSVRSTQARTPAPGRGADRASADAFAYVVHKDSVERREQLKRRFNRNLREINESEQDKDLEDFHRFMPGDTAFDL